MNWKGILFFCAVFSSISAFAQQSDRNDVYGVISEIVLRTDVNNDFAIYFRVDSSYYDASYAHCVTDKESFTWNLDINNPITAHQYDLLQQSYQKQLPVRVIGHSNICDSQSLDNDTVFEISPWSWPTILNARNAKQNNQSK